MKKLILLFIVTAFTFSNAQQLLEKTLKGYTRPDEVITLSASIGFNQAIELLSKVSENVSGKKIVSTVDNNNPIGIEINNMAYDKALLLIVQFQGLVYEIKEDVIVVKSKNEPEKKEISPDIYASVDARDVNISAVFFEMDVSSAKKKGIDWKFLLSGNGLDVGGLLGVENTFQKTQSTGDATTTATPDFNLTTEGKFDMGSFFGEATAVFKFFENENMGEIIASPNITVRDGKKGRIQVGSDFSIKQKDFSGNVVESFFSTGSIIEVTPHVYNEDNIDYLLLDIKVERSSYIPDPLSTEIKKTQANTQVLMVNGEETVIGGLFVNEETNVRTGIPFLKDLPWWVLGLRYIFGSDEKRVSKKELIILIKADLVPTLKERVNSLKNDNPLHQEVKKYRDKVKYYEFQEQNNNEEK